MPQMMPLNWMVLFIYFVILFLMFNIFLYFNYIKKQSHLKSKYNLNLNWKW